MNITFLIGNGFDMNLGLDTQFKDFIKKYKNSPSSNEIIKMFKKEIEENIDLWSNAEVEFGKYSRLFKKGEANKFSLCQADFCRELAIYLKSEENKLNYEWYKEEIKCSFNNLNVLTDSFLLIEKNQIDSIYKKYNSESIIFNFINYNYTYTLDNFLKIVVEDNDTIGTHKHGSVTLKHQIGEVCHVHGTVDGSMVLGVNDDSQIANNDIFECENGDIYKSLLIKQEANRIYLENTDSKANRLILNSKILYIYGMSIGETDKLWWNRIASWLANDGDRQIIIYKHDMPRKDVLPVQYLVREREESKKILMYSNYSEKVKVELQNRIHITTKDIFEDVKNIGTTKKSAIIA